MNCLLKYKRNQLEHSNNSIGPCDVEQLEVSTGQAKISSLETIIGKLRAKLAQAQLFSFSMGHGKELPSGDYLVKYAVDNQTLISKLIELKQ